VRSTRKTSILTHSQGALHHRKSQESKKRRKSGFVEKKAESTSVAVGAALWFTGFVCCKGPLVKI
jgi:hypothetical protein